MIEPRFIKVRWVLQNPSTFIINEMHKEDHWTRIYLSHSVSNSTWSHSFCSVPDEPSFLGRIKVQLEFSFYSGWVCQAIHIELCRFQWEVQTFSPWVTTQKRSFALWLKRLFSTIFRWSYLKNPRVAHSFQEILRESWVSPWVTGFSETQDSETIFCLMNE